MPIHKTCIPKPPKGRNQHLTPCLAAQTILIQEGFTPRRRGQKTGMALKQERRVSALWLRKGVAHTPQEFTQDGTN